VYHPLFQYNKVSLQFFRNGRKCLEEYESMLSGTSGQTEELAKAELEELSNKKPRLSSTPEDSSPPRGLSMGFSVANAARRAEQDLTGFEDGDNDARDKAIGNQNFLHRLAEALGDLAGGSEHRQEHHTARSSMAPNRAGLCVHIISF
jgi:hypothetical protein